jgi:hypothetical protein
VPVRERLDVKKEKGMRKKEEGDSWKQQRG